MLKIFYDLHAKNTALKHIKLAYLLALVLSVAICGSILL